MTSVNVEQSQLSRWVLGLLLVSMSMLSAQLYAAPATIELFSGGGTSQNTPTTTTQTNTYQANNNNPTDNVASAYSPTTTVSYAVSSRFSTSTYNSLNNQPDLMFGGTVNTGGTAVADAATYSSIGGSANQPTKTFRQHAKTPPQAVPMVQPVRVGQQVVLILMPTMGRHFLRPHGGFRMQGYRPMADIVMEQLPSPLIGR